MPKNLIPTPLPAVAVCLAEPKRGPELLLDQLARQIGHPRRCVAQPYANSVVARAVLPRRCES